MLQLKWILGTFWHYGFTLKTAQGRRNLQALLCFKIAIPWAAWMVLNDASSLASFVLAGRASLWAIGEIDKLDPPSGENNTPSAFEQKKKWRNLQLPIQRLK
jgi:hypothetical protein